jgi:hypothetical protein
MTKINLRLFQLVDISSTKRVSFGVFSLIFDQCVTNPDTHWWFHLVLVVAGVAPQAENYQ